MQLFKSILNKSVAPVSLVTFMMAGLVFLVSPVCRAQELFSLTDPASNVAAGSFGFKVDNLIMDEINTSKINYHLIPEVVVGVSKQLMVRGNIFLSNRSDKLRKEGGSLYAKYRFLSKDKVQRHFRMAAFGRSAINNSDIHQEEININGHNSGFETGLVATQLLQRVAVSGSVSFIKAYDNGNGNKFIYGADNSKAIAYTLSVGKLMYPREYKSYKQTNINCMLESINQVNTGSGKYYYDLGASVQMIFNSQSRVDIGYRRELVSNMLRTAPNGLFIRLEHTLFNVL
jgi:hypothetical protein